MVIQSFARVQESRLGYPLPHLLLIWSSTPIT
jgi:hypothetical protein